MDAFGESFLFVTQREYKLGRTLIAGDLEPITSALLRNEGLHRLILEGFCSGLVSSAVELRKFISTSFAQKFHLLDEHLNSIISELLTDAFLVQTDDGGIAIAPLGKAAVRCLHTPSSAKALLDSLQTDLRNGIILGEDAHLIYLVTQQPTFYPPLERLLPLLRAATPAQLKLAERLGITPEYLMARESGSGIGGNDTNIRCQRFFVSLALGELVSEVPLQDVARRFGVPHGDLQQLQTSCAGLAYNMLNFCQEVDLNHLVVLLKDLVQRLAFGVKAELLDLMQVVGFLIPRCLA